MLNFNTNLNSLLLQKSLRNSTNILNQAIERMSTGFKINSAKDNAANFAIANQMTSQISSLDVAEDNISSGLDMLSIASDTLDLINSRFIRLRDLAMQAENKTYGDESLKAINKECEALVAEIKRLYKEAEFNGLKIYGTEFSETIPTDGTGTIATFGTDPMPVPQATSTYATEATTLQELGIDYSSFQIYNSEKALIESYDTEKADTIGDIFDVLETYGFTCSITDGVISISSTNGRYVDGELMRSFGINLDATDFVQSSSQNSDTMLYYTATQTATEATTLGDLGVLTSGTDTVTINDKYGDFFGDIVVNANTTLGGLFNALEAYNIFGSTEDGVITLSSFDGNYVVSQGVIASLGIGTFEGGNAVTIGTSQTSSGVVTYESIITTGGEVITVQQEVTTTVWSTTTTSETITSTVLVTYTISETITETVWAVTTYETIYTTNVTEETVVSLTGSTTNPSYTDEEVAAMTAIKSVSSFTSGQTYKIETTSDLKYLANRVNIGKDTSGAIFVLANDIDMSSISGFTQIGYDYAFKGTFDGNGHVISNLTISPTFEGAGLFGYASGATIKNVSLENCNITGSYDVGALVGKADYDTTIENCYATGSVTGTGTAIGGLVGDATWITIKNCYAKCTVSGLNFVGGLVGSTNRVTVVNCYTSATVSGNNKVGGLVGQTYNSSTAISNCYVSCVVTATGDNIGGLVGDADGTISNCYAIGIVSGSNNVGGFVGSSSSTIINCASTQSDSYATQMSLAQIQSTYTPSSMGFTETNGWKVTDGTPILSWQAASMPTTITVLTTTTAMTTQSSTVYVTGTCSETSGTTWATVTSVATTTITVDVVTTIPQVTTETIWTTTTTSETLTETVWAVKTTETIWTTNVTEATVVYTVETESTGDGITVTVIGTATLDTTLGELGVTDGMTCVVNQQYNTKRTITAQSTQTLGDFINRLETYGVYASLTDGVLCIGASTNAYLSGDICSILGITTETINAGRTIPDFYIPFDATYTTTGTTVLTTVTTGNFMNSVTVVDTSTIASLSSLAITSSISAGSTYKISTTDELVQFATMINNNLDAGTSSSNINIVLANDIDLTGVDWVSTGTLNNCNFNGNGYKITGLSSAGGLFGRLSSAKVYNLGLEVDIVTPSTNTSVGGLANSASYATITNCYVTGDIEGAARKNSFYGVGGLVGNINNANIDSCYASVNILTTITLTEGDTYGAGYAGGLVGSISGVTITNSYTSGSIEGGWCQAGGVVGTCSGQYIKLSTVQSSMSLSSLEAPQYSTFYAGGIVGRVSDSITIDKAYFNGVIVNSDNRMKSGAIIGKLDAQSVSLTKIGSNATNVEFISVSDCKRDITMNDSLSSAGITYMSIAVTDTDGTSFTITVNTTKTLTELNEDLNLYGIAFSGNNTGGCYIYALKNGRNLTVTTNQGSFNVTNSSYGRLTISSSSTLLDDVVARDANGDPLTSVIPNETSTETIYTVTVQTTTTEMTTQSSTVYVTGTCSETSGTTWSTNVSTTTEVVTILVTTTETTTQTSVQPLLISQVQGNPSYTNEEVAAMINIQSVSSFTSGQAYKIETAEDLAYLATMVNTSGISTYGAIFVLANDIDLSGYSNWAGIGTDTNKFKGTFDGNGHVVENLTIVDDYVLGEVQPLGLFGYTKYGSEIKNLGLKNVNITSEEGYYAGALVGVSSSHITNCYVQGGTIRSGEEVGGLVGRSENAVTIKNCYTSCTVSATYDTLGGLIGWAKDSNIINCYATGDITSDICNAGGLVGRLDGGTIANSYTTGNVSAASIVGGIAGYANGSIINSYATGTVESSDEEDFGGLIGDTGGVCSVTNCAATQADSNATVMTEQQIKSTYTHESMGFTEANGWILPTVEEIVVSTHIATATVTTTNVTSITKDVGVDEVLEETIYETTTTSTTQTITTSVGETVQEEKTVTVYSTIVTSTTKDVTIDEILEHNTITTTVTEDIQTETVWTTTTTQTTRTDIIDVTETIDGETTTTNVSMTMDTTFDQLGLTSRGYITVMSNGTKSVITIQVGNKVSNLMTKLNGYGIITTLSDGQITITPTVKDIFVLGMSENLANILKLDSDFYTTSLGQEMTDSNTYIYDGEIVLNNNTTLSQIGVTSGNIVVKKDGNDQSTIAVSSSQSIGSFLEELEDAGFRAYCMDGCLYLRADGDMYLGNATTGSSNAITVLRLTNVSQDLDSTYSNTNSDQLEKLSEIINTFWQASSEITLQIGINSDEHSRMEVSTGFTMENLDRFANIGKKTVTNYDYIAELDAMISTVTAKQTELGAYMSRLESALEEVTIKYDNLVSSRSTLRDADLAEVSSTYITQQILQQASATLLSVVNQSPQLALQLL